MRNSGQSTYIGHIDVWGKTQLNTYVFLFPIMFFFCYGSRSTSLAKFCRFVLTNFELAILTITIKSSDNSKGDKRTDKKKSNESLFENVYIVRDSLFGLSSTQLYECCNTIRLVYENLSGCLVRFILMPVCVYLPSIDRFIDR